MATTQAVQREMVKLSALRPGDEITLTVEWLGELATSQKDGWPDQYKWKFEGNKIAFLSIAQNRMLEEANAAKGDTFTIRKIETKNENRKGVYYEAIKHGEEPAHDEPPPARQRYDDPKDRPADKFTADRCEWCNEFSVETICDKCLQSEREIKARAEAAQRTATAAKQVQPAPQRISEPPTRKPATSETIGSQPQSQQPADDQLLTYLTRAITVVAAAERYAQSIGFALHFEAPEIQDMATTLFINAERTGGHQRAA